MWNDCKITICPSSFLILHEYEEKRCRKNIDRSEWKVHDNICFEIDDHDHCDEDDLASIRRINYCRKQSQNLENYNGVT
jgi:hypothetical protein